MADKKVVHQDVDDYGVELIDNKATTQDKQQHTAKPKQNTSQAKT